MAAREERGVKHTYSVQHDAWFTQEVRVRIDPSSFARGGMRKAHRMWEMESGGFTDAVAKFSTIAEGEKARSQHFADCRMQMIAEAYAQQFNRRSPADAKVAFVVAQVLELVDRPGRPTCTVEPLLDGAYAKHNDNTGHVFDANACAAAFSHFTYAESCEQLVIVDIQGVGGSLYTDPQVHSADCRGFGAGNLGPSGIRRFLQTHRCNSICRTCGLPAVAPTASAAPPARPELAGGLDGIGRFGGLGGGGGALPALGPGAGMSVPMQALLQNALRAMAADGHRAGAPAVRVRDGDGLRVVQLGGAGGAGPERRAPRARGGAHGAAHDDEVADLSRALAASERDARRREERELQRALRQSAEVAGNQAAALHAGPRGRYAGR